MAISLLVVDATVNAGLSRETIAEIIMNPMTRVNLSSIADLFIYTYISV